MTTIYRANNARLSVADAKRLILGAVPLEQAVDVYAQVDDEGCINFDGPIECRVNEAANIQASHLDHDFLKTCNDLDIRPRMKYRPVITDYNGDVSRDGTYTIAHDEFVTLAEIFGLLVVTGEAPVTQTTTPSPAPVATESASGGGEPVTGKRWTPEKLAELKSYREKHGTKKAAEFFRISEQLIRQKLPSEKPQPKGYSAFTHRMK